MFLEWKTGRPLTAGLHACVACPCAWLAIVMCVVCVLCWLRLTKNQDVGQPCIDSHVHVVLAVVDPPMWMYGEQGYMRAWHVCVCGRPSLIHPLPRVQCPQCMGTMCVHTHMGMWESCGCR